MSQTAHAFIIKNIEMRNYKKVLAVFKNIGLFLLTLSMLAAFKYFLQTERIASKPSDAFYRAGVVEFAPAEFQGSTLKQLNDNLREYIAIINSDKAWPLDIIVFPELTLNNAQYLTEIPEPTAKTVPCNNPRFEPFLRNLSCAAKYTQKYVVVNLLEKEFCSESSQAAKNDPRPCAPSGWSEFNTNVAFDRNGTIIARYRKFNSYDLSLNVTYKPELSTFDTDFGVRFGMFICFDINFYSPVQQLVDMGIKNFIYSSFWFSELPFLTANQLQQSWAFANNVNLLAAGASNPSGGTTGSGIFSGHLGALTSVMAHSPERKLYTARVPKVHNEKTSEAIIEIISEYSESQELISEYSESQELISEYSESQELISEYSESQELISEYSESQELISEYSESQELISEYSESQELISEYSESHELNGGTGIRLMRDYRMEDFTSELLEVSCNRNSAIEKNLCHGAFCCNFNLELSQNSHQDCSSSYKYHLAVFDGDRKYSGFGYTKYKFCAVYACTGETLDSCGMVFNEGEELSAETVFMSISIEGEFPKAEKVLIMPNSLNLDLSPLSTDRFKFDIKDNGNTQYVKYRLLKPADNLLTFGIYANYYDNTPLVRSYSTA